MKVCLLRHAEAEGYRAPDAERALTARGREQARQAGAWLASRLENPAPGGLLLVSPYRRAQETASAVNELLAMPFQALEELTPDVDPRRAVSTLQAFSDEVEVLVVVSHMPLVAAMAQVLEEGVAGAGQGFMPAEIRIYEMPALMPGLGRRLAGFIPDPSR